jgi:hypothetical protein
MLLRLIHRGIALCLDAETAWPCGRLIARDWKSLPITQIYRFR